MNIDQRLQGLVYKQLDRVDLAEGFTPEEKRVLKAAVTTMAEGFAEMAYAEIPDGRARLDCPAMLELFFAGVRWHWALDRPEIGHESWATYLIAMQFPLSDIALDLLIRRFEFNHRPIWNAVEEERAA